MKKILDRNGEVLRKGSKVRFYSGIKGKTMTGVVVDERALGQMLSVLMANDPYPTYVPLDRIEKFDRSNKSVIQPKRSKPPRKAVMSPTNAAKRPAKKTVKKSAPLTKKPVAELENVVPPSKRKPANKAAKKSVGPRKEAAKRGPKPRDPAENGNPFRPGTNNFFIAQELIKGGRRDKIIERMLKKITLNPWRKKMAKLDLAFEMDKRILMAKHQLIHKHGFTFESKGRGTTGTIKAFPPVAKARGAKKATKKTKKAA